MGAQKTRIPLLERDQAPPEIATVYDALLKQRGVVPNMFKTLSHTPGLALGIAGFLKSLLSDSALPGWYKELVATRLSVLNNSQYAISAHALSAKQKGATEAQITAVSADFEDGPLPKHRSWASVVQSACIVRAAISMTSCSQN
jgi:AhpD family alkylhydroperoxidase